jgi:membrane-bound lytic murein transglycosylase B
MRRFKPAIFTMFTIFKVRGGNLRLSSWFLAEKPELHMPFNPKSLAIALCLFVSPALAAPACQTGDFDSWLDGVRQEAAARGVSRSAITAGLQGAALDQSVLRHDRGQKVFRQTFEEFSARMVNPRLARANTMLRKHAGLFQRIETQYGVPAEVLVAIWGLETDFGSYNGSFSTIQALATLAYDCRRTEMFRAELIDALKIVDRGDMQPAAMKGAWAGEIGQTQFMPSSYLKFAVDFDGDGRRDLVASVPDVLASTANYLKGYGWKRGEGWDPGQPNFAIIKQWNKADVYSRTIAYFATRLAGGGGMR